MTDLLTRPPEVATPRNPVTAGDAPQEPRQWFLASLLAGAGFIHLVMVPTHLGDSTTDGLAFLLAAWAQLTLAVLTVTRPRRWVWTVALGTSVGALAAWIVSRTTGLPWGAHAGEAESVAFVDAVAALLAFSAILVAVGLLVGHGTRPRTSRTTNAAAVVASIAALALATAAVVSPSAREHGDGAGAAHGHSEVAGDDLGFAALANGQMGHEHDEDDTEPPTITPEDAGLLATQLALTAELAERYPTIRHAKEAGYWQAGPFSPGLGIHYNAPGPGSIDPSGVFRSTDIDSAILIFDGTDDDAPLAGFMFMSYGEAEPEGFAGPLDRWHYHTAVCIVFDNGRIETPFGADLEDVTQEMCAAEGGSLVEFTGWMVHVWTVPGYESELGTFSDLNPKITCADGTYHRIPTKEIGGRDSTCLDV